MAKDKQTQTQEQPKATDAVVEAATMAASAVMNPGDLVAELARLKAENERLHAERRNESVGLTIKVSPKGGISVYGLGKFPVTLYPQQWERLAERIPTILQFIEDNREKDFTVEVKDGDGKPILDAEGKVKTKTVKMSFKQGQSGA